MFVTDSWYYQWFSLLDPGFVIFDDEDSFDTTEDGESDVSDGSVDIPIDEDSSTVTAAYP